MSGKQVVKPKSTPIEKTKSGSSGISFNNPKFHVGSKQNRGPFKSVNKTPKPEPKPTPIPQFTNHSEQVCSSWGYYHFKSFDGDIYYYPGKCKYLFASHCKGSQEDFSILFQRTEEDGVPVINHIALKIHGVIIEIFNNSILLDGERVTETPVDKERVLLDRVGNHLKITYTSDIYFMWNGEDSMLLKLNRNKYRDQTCGMCGDFNGINGLTFDGIEVTAVQFGNMQKRNKPTEDCPDVSPTKSTTCTDKKKICENVLKSEAFSNCNMLLDPVEYIDICVQDLCKCSSKNQMLCLCNMFAEYSRQCTHAGGVPGNWRTPKLCPKTCPLNMVHQEYGSPCLNTCSNTERSTVCEDHNVDGCFCPIDTVLDDINNIGCIPQENCFCVYDGKKYSPGSTYSTTCRACTCSKGKWKCKELPCTGSCSVEGGSHITTFDGYHYSANGDCSYVLAKHSTGHDFVLLGELRRCGISNSKSCLKGVVLVLNGGEIVLSVKENCVAFLNWMSIQPPISVANMTISQPTSFFLNIHTTFGLSMMIQCVPVMQIYINIDSSYEHQTCGLCGNYNNIQTDDFKALSGVIEGTAAAFVNTWKTLASCPNIKNNYEDPCSLNVEKEKYALHWCALLTSATGPFSACHSLKSPLIYHANCMSDTCSGMDSEACMCAALSSYAFACAKKGVVLTGWRDNVCQKYMQTCRESQVYRYHVNQFQPTCQSLSEAHATRNAKLVPVDGCVCSDGTYMNDNGDCVAASSCPCYYQGNVMQSGEMIEENGVACTCDKGQLNCMGKITTRPVCTDPLIYINCTTSLKGTKGVECQKSCDTLDMDCYSSQCISGCVCPKGLVSDGKGGCISEEQCPCIHNEAEYRPGTSISVACNTCTCKNRKWQCTLEQCLGSCSVYGNGHHISFDNKHFTFTGTCEYTLVQDNCGEDGGQNSFRVIMQNVQCGFNGTICTKTFKIFFGGEELRLDNKKIEVVKREEKNKIQYEIIRRGLYIIFKGVNGQFIMWDTNDAIQIKLSSDFKRKVCGICGNYDGNSKNDFTTRSHLVVENLMEFYNSWKTDPKCPDVYDVKNPCSINPYRKAWATKQCAIITSDVFQPCHSQVDPAIYYDSCTSDSCSCVSGGDCECFCTAVAAYAQACSENGVCIRWRTPNICPMFCDYYNDAGECAWHYKPCGDKCMKTCKNPKGECLYELSGLEGCYPSCPASKPYLDEDNMKCVPQCGCEDGNGNFYNYGEKVPTKENCYSCECTPKGISCQYDITACRCEHKGKMYFYSEDIPSDEDGSCNQIKCDINGTIVIVSNLCTTVQTPQPHCAPQCHWTQWYDESNPSENELGDIETYDTITSKGKVICKNKIYAQNVECRLANSSNDQPSSIQKIFYTCDVINGSVCINSNQDGPMRACRNLEIRFLCCDDFSLCLAEIPTTKVTSFTSVVSTTLSYLSSLSTILNTSSKITSSAFTVTQPSFSTSATFPSKSTSQPTTGNGVTQSTPYVSSETARRSSESSISTTTIPTSNFFSPTIEITSTPSTTQPIFSTSTVSVSSFNPNTPSSHLTTSTKPGTPSQSSTSTTSCTYCHWTDWYNVNHPFSSEDSGDQESFEIAKSKGISKCSAQSYIQDIKCEASSYPDIPFKDLGQNATCTVKSGLICKNNDNNGEFNKCHNYKVSFYCCEKKNCPPPTTTTATSPSKSISQPTTGNGVTQSTPYVSSETASRSSESSISTTTIPTSTFFSPTIEITSTPSTTQPIFSTSTFSTSSSNPNTPSSHLTTSTTPETPSQSSTSMVSSITSCNYCHWTDWYNVNHPISNEDSGDQESFEIVKSKGISKCSAQSYIQDIKCEASSYPDIPFEDLGQNATCSVKSGLICRNKDNNGDFNMCFDYKVSFYCCEKQNCPPPSTTTATSPSKSTSQPTTGNDITQSTPYVSSETPSRGSESSISTTTIPTSTFFSPTIEITSTPSTTQPIFSTSTFSTSSSNPNTPSSPLTTSIKPETPSQSSTSMVSSTTSCNYCHWTDWYNVNHPFSREDSGDQESFEIAKSKGIAKCSAQSYIQDIKCEASSYPDIPIEDLRQNATCTVKSGLICRNNNNNDGEFNKCHNYKVSFYCCEKKNCPPPTTTTATFPSTSQPTTGNGVTQSTPYVSSETVSRSSKNSISTTTIPTSTFLSPTIEITSTPSTTKPIFSTSTFSTYSSNPNTPSSHLTTSTIPETPSQSSTSMVSSTTSCNYCHWTDWYNENHPISNEDSGDQESFEIVKSKGISKCSAQSYIQDIKCEASSYPGIPFEDLGQNAKCSVKSGLICRNKDNNGEFNMCLDYKVSFYCCEKQNCPPPSTTTATSPSKSTSQPTTDNDITQSTLYVSSETSSRGSESSITTTTIPTSTFLSPTIEITSTLSTAQPIFSTSTFSTSSSNPNTPSSPLTTSTTPETPSQSSTSMVSSTTSCNYCHWTDWYNVNHPISNEDSGDQESFEIVKSKGISKCSAQSYIQDIKCEATSYPGIPFEDLGQNAKCNVKLGLICKNKDNNGEFNMCLDYKVSFYCCEKQNCPPPSTTTATSPSKSTSQPTTGNDITQSTLYVSSETPSIGSESSISTTTIPTTTFLSPTIEITSTPSTTRSIFSTSTFSTSSSNLNTPSSPLTTSTKPETPSQSSTSMVSSTTSCNYCHWTDWYNVNHPISNEDSGDQESFEIVKSKGISKCSAQSYIQDIKCEATSYPGIPFEDLGQNAKCNVKSGLICKNKDNNGEFNMCLDYKVSFYCCEKQNCPPPSTTTATSPSKSTSQPTTGNDITQSTLYVSSETPSRSSKSSISTTTVPTSTFLSPTIEITSTPSTTRPIFSTSTFSTSSSNPNTPSSPLTTSTKPETPSQSSTSMVSSTTSCNYCHWTDWYNVNHPISNEESGDQESFEIVKSKGISKCSAQSYIQDIKCEATSYPGIPFEDLGQNAKCNVKLGLICKNKDNNGEFNMCLDYKVSFYCCEKQNCPPPSTTTATSPSKSTSQPTTGNDITQSTPYVSSETPSIGSESSISTTTIPTTTFLSPTIEITSTPSTTRSIFSTSTFSTSSSNLNTPSSPLTTSTKPETPSQSSTSMVSSTTSCNYCHWTDWYNVNHPISNEDSGDQESFEIVKSKGISKCSAQSYIQDIKCEATSYPGIPFEDLGQNAKCNVKSGLICKNKDNNGEFNMCLDYKVSFYCCEKQNCPPPSTTTATSPSKSTSQPTTGNDITQSTLYVSSETPSRSSKSSISTTTVPTSTFLSPTIEITSTPSTTRPIFSTSTFSTSSSNPNTPSSPLTTSTKPETPSQSSTSMVSSTTSCNYCHWTDWYNVNHPISNEESGDQESFEIVKSKGISKCSAQSYIQDIKCEATSYPGIPFEDLGQNAKCNVKLGLICKNKDNNGEFNMCLDYKVSFYCCEKQNCPPPSTTTATSPSKSTSQPTTGNDITQSTPYVSSETPSIGSESSISTTTIPTTTFLSPTIEITSTPSTTRSIFSTSTFSTSSSNLNTPSSPLTTSTKPETPSQSSTSMVSSTTSCNYCHWTDWYNVNHPISNEDSGDQESFEIVKSKGISKCSAQSYIQDIKCEATSYPGIPFEDLGQNAKCNVKSGLICKNKDNNGEFNMCLDYKVSFYCCEKQNCPPPSTTTATSPSKSTSQPTTGNDITQSTLYVSSETPSRSSKSSISTTTVPTSTFLSPTIEITSTPSTTRPIFSTSTFSTSSSNPNTPSSPLTTSTKPETPSQSSTSMVSSTTSCNYCHWTDWYNVNHPISNEDSGDQESFEIVKSKGISKCSAQSYIQDIKCEATSYPGIPFEDLGQNAKCNVKLGLICKNKDNNGEFNMCLDYKVSFYCCEKQNCPPPSTTTATSPSKSTSQPTTGNDITQSTPYVSSETPSIGSESSISTTTIPTTTFLSPTIEITSTPSTTRSIFSASTFSTSSSNLNTPSSPLTTSTKPETPSQSSTSMVSSTTSCNYCHWTDWYNVNHPISNEDSGDQESFEIVKSKGISKCSAQSYIQDIKCEATSYPGIPFEDLGQNAKCNVKSGLICKNKDNNGEFNMCLDYKVSFYCCEKQNCPPPSTTTATSPSKSTSQPTTGNDITQSTLYVSSETPSRSSKSSISTTTVPTSTFLSPTIEITSTPSTTQPIFSASTFSKSSSNPNTPSSPLTTSIKPESPSQSSTSMISSTTSCNYCHWTDWYNINHPISNEDSGDQESFEIVKSKGISKCSAQSYIQDIKCEASSYPGIPFEDLGQNATCSVKSGLICRNKDNNGEFNMCLDYKVSYYCCEKHQCPSSTISSISTSLVTSLSSSPSIKSTKHPNPPEFCVYRGSTYKVGSPIPQPPESCEKCKCTGTMNNYAEITCKPIMCNTNCQMGYTYREVDGQCCGKCVQEYCVLNNTVPIKPGTVWNPPGDKCTSYDCEPDTFVVVKNIMSCPQQKPIDCQKGILVNLTSTDGCCTIQFCEPRKCDVMKSLKLIESGGCSANVTLTNCGGYCSSVSRHPNFPKMQKHDCTCCQATKTTTKNIQLDCYNGRKIGYTFTDILQCSCRNAACVFTE
ncbi:uncharacterized protein ACMZJ9_016793 [Mantella aurantiaca]